MDDDIRETLGAALDADQEVDTSVDTSPPESRDVSGAEHGEVVAEAREVPEGEGRVRDALGRFVKTQAELDAERVSAAAAAPQAGQPPTAQAPGLPAPAQAVPAPQSWTPAARETWAAIPPAAQAEIARREADMTRGMSESASARSIAHQFNEACTPYLGRMRMQGVNPIQAFDNLLAIEMTLGQGSPQQKVETIAKMISSYGVDLGALDAHLAGAAPSQDVLLDQRVEQLLQQRMAPVQQLLQQISQHRQQTTQQAQEQIGTEIQTFGTDPKHEFFNDVRGIMADVIDVAAKNGASLSMQEAYDRAVLIHPQTKGVIEARQRGMAAQGLNGAAQRARRAAVSVTGSPALGNPDGEEPNTLRDAIAASFDSMQRV